MHFCFSKSLLKKLISIVLINIAIVFNLASCGWNGEEYVKKIEGEEISFSEFLLLTSLQAVSAENNLKVGDDYGGFDFESFREGEIEGSPALDYIKDKVNDEMEEILVKRVAAKKLNVTLNKEEEETVKKNGYDKFKNLNSSFKAGKIGISLKDCENFVLWEMLEKKIGEELYGKGKPGEIKEEAVKNYAKDKKNVRRFKFLKIKKESKKEENKKEENKEKEKEESFEEKLQKKFSVKTSKELAENMLKKINENKKSLEDIQKELKEGLGEGTVSLEEKISYLNEKDEENYNFNEDANFNKDIKKFLKEMDEKKESKKIFETQTHAFIIETIDMDDDSIKNENQKIIGILQNQAQDEFLKKVKEEIKDKIDTNEHIVDASSAKQIKKVCENKVSASQFPF